MSITHSTDILYNTLSLGKLLYLRTLFGPIDKVSLKIHRNFTNDCRFKSQAMFGFGPILNKNE